MAGRIFRALDCFPHDPPTNHPRIKITLFDAAKEQWPQSDVLAPIDTGFSGSVMLPEQEYQFFMIGELPKRFWKDYRTLTGPVQMRVAKAFIRTGDNEVLEETNVETPQLGTGKLLVGRAVLDKCSVLLDGPVHSSCLMETQMED